MQQKLFDIGWSATEALIKDVKKMLLQQTRKFIGRSRQQSMNMKKMEEGIWLELALALMRNKTKEDWTEKHRNVARMLFLEGGWVQKRLFRKWEQKAKTSKKEWKWQRGIVAHPLSESQWNRVISA